uniref:Uncharacterized protein n=1 Tax=Arcella intermedia TaxID=1963864 RepID=A0A6B2LDH4_9EUKA
MSERTSYQWKFNDVKTKREVEEELLFGPVPIPVKRDVPLGPSDIPPEITEEERREQERKKTKLEIKKYNKRKEAVLEEIAPKPSTPRESKMEKNKIKKISVSPFFPFPISPSLSFSSPTEVVKEYDDTNSFKVLLERQKEHKDRRNSERREKIQQKIDEHKIKEDKTMAMLRELAAAKGYL